HGERRNRWRKQWFCLLRIQLQICSEGLWRLYCCAERAPLPSPKKLGSQKGGHRGSPGSVLEREHARRRARKKIKMASTSGRSSTGRKSPGVGKSGRRNSSGPLAGLVIYVDAFLDDRSP
ncbi:unnamed protein product, partial [Ectocarpus sp. 8 AP-2014]